MRIHHLVVAWSVALSGLTGCGTEGDQGPAGMKGPPGPGVGVVWRDYAGTFVGRTAGPFDDLFVVDDGGVFWRINTITGLIDIPETDELVLYYDAPDCGGEPYILSDRKLPNVVYQVPLMTDRYLAMPGTPDIALRTGSLQNETGCVSPFSDSIAARRLDSIEVTAPALEFELPLVPEAVDADA